MSKCLRCGAGSEWIEGNVKAEPCSAFTRAEFEEALTFVIGSAQQTGHHFAVWGGRAEQEANARLGRARAALVRLVFGEEPEVSK